MKRMLDLYLQSNYIEVLKYTKHFIQRLKIPSSVDADAVINNAYIHCTKLDLQDATQEKAKSYLLNTIKYDLIWTQGSRTKKDDIYKSQEYIGDSIEDNSDLDHKLAQEEIHSVRKSIIEIYRTEQKDVVKKIIFEAYYDKGYSTQTALAKYFDINCTSAYYLIKEIKKNINEIQYRYEEN